MGIRAPNNTHTPNEIFDEWLPRLKLVELRVLMVIIRKTFGWQKARDRISLSQLETLTGSQRTSIINGAKNLEKMNLIRKIVVGENGEKDTYYELIVDDCSNNNYTNSNNFNQCETRTPPSAKFAPTKETLTKETKSPVVPKGTPLPSDKIPPRKKCREDKSEVASRVFVSSSQHESLLKDAKGNLELVNAWYEKLSKWKISKGWDGGRNDYQALIGWVRDAVKEDVAKKSHSPENRIQSSREFCEKIKTACPGIENRSGVTFGISYVEHAPSPTGHGTIHINFTDYGFEEQMKGLARKLGYILKDL